MATILSRESLPFAFLPIRKEPGPTSHDVVAAVRRLMPKGVKVGHTGTLDPFAQGVLLLAIGKATRFTEDVHALEKTYDGIIRLGQQTDTLDPSGKVVSTMAVPPLDKQQVAEVAGRFQGHFLQTPPVFSAKKVNGVRSYKLARSEQTVELQPKQVHVSHIELGIEDSQNLRVRVSCSTGTYVRSIARDVAEAMGTCGFLASLVRTAVGSVQLSHCVTLDQLDAADPLQHTLPVEVVLPQYPEIQLPLEAFSDLVHGRPFYTREVLPSTFIGAFVREGRVHAMYKCSYEKGVGVSQNMLCWMRSD